MSCSPYSLKIECKKIESIDVVNIQYAPSNSKSDIFVTLKEVMNTDEILESLDEDGLIAAYVKNVYKVELPAL